MGYRNFCDGCDQNREDVEPWSEQVSPNDYRLVQFLCPVCRHKAELALDTETPNNTEASNVGTQS